MQQSGVAFPNVSMFIDRPGVEHICKFPMNEPKIREIITVYFFKIIYNVEKKRPKEPISLSSFINMLPDYLSKLLFYDDNYPGKQFGISHFVARELKLKGYGLFEEDTTILPLSEIKERKIKQLNKRQTLSKFL